MRSGGCLIGALLLLARIPLDELVARCLIGGAEVAICFSSVSQFPAATPRATIQAPSLTDSMTGKKATPATLNTAYSATATVLQESG